MTWKIPLFDSDHGEEEAAAAAETVRSGWLTMGERCRRFEEELAEELGVRHVLAFANCTAALHAAYLALGVGPGDEVVLPSLTFVATANAVAYTGATPVFCDIESEATPLVSPRTIEAVLTERTRCVAVVHYAGRICDMAAIRELCDPRGIRVVEDCAHAVGIRRDGHAAGGWGDAGCFSFFSNKNLSTGEGGALSTNSDEVAATVKLLRSHGMTTLTMDRHKGHAFDYDVVALGYNYRPTEITAALASVQLKKLQPKDRRRRALTELYRVALADGVPEVFVPFLEHPGECAYHVMPVLLPEGADRAAVMAGLKERGVQSSIHYRAVHTMELYRAAVHAPLPATESVAARELTLPLYPGMSDGDVAYVVQSLRDALAS